MSVIGRCEHCERFRELRFCDCLVDEAVRQGRLATGAMKDADDARQQLQGAVETLTALYDAAVALDNVIGPMAEPEYEAWGDAMDRARTLLGGQ